MAPAKELARAGIDWPRLKGIPSAGMGLVLVPSCWAAYFLVKNVFISELQWPLEGSRRPPRDVHEAPEKFLDGFEIVFAGFRVSSSKSWF